LSISSKAAAILTPTKVCTDRGTATTRLLRLMGLPSQKSARWRT